MVPAPLASAWKKMRAVDSKSGRHHASRSQSEVISSVRLQALMATSTTSARSRASISSSSSSGSSSHATEDNEAATSVRNERRARSATATCSSQPQLPLKVFVGSWNMAAKDPFVTSSSKSSNSSGGTSAGYIGDENAAAMLKDLLPRGYDVYVLGTQEKVTPHLHKAVLARLHAASEHDGRKFFTMRQPQETKAKAKATVRKRRAHSTPTRTSTTTSHKQQEEDGEEEDEDETTASPSPHHSSHRGSFLDRCRQSRSNSSFALEASATRTNQDDSQQQQTGAPRVSFKEVRGRGDGAFLRSKATSLALYCAKDLEEIVEIATCGAHKFSWSSGSKGGVAVMLRVASSGQTITFANCHLEANKPCLRRKQLEALSTKLGHALGGYQDLASSSDHVVWMGDFNYRVHTLDGDTVLKALASGHHLEIHDRYDSMKDDVASVSSMDTFTEPTKWPTFYPTYKKIPGRPHSLDVKDTKWPLKVYRTKYKEPFYKGGQVKARVPGWCDRILYCSKDQGEVEETSRSSTTSRRSTTRSSSSGSTLKVEQVACAKDKSLRDNYRAVNEGLCGSDHSPVFCTFAWTVAMEMPTTWG